VIDKILGRMSRPNTSGGEALALPFYVFARTPLTLAAFEQSTISFSVQVPRLDSQWCLAASGVGAGSVEEQVESCGRVPSGFDSRHQRILLNYPSDVIIAIDNDVRGADAEFVRDELRYLFMAYRYDPSTQVAVSTRSGRVPVLYRPADSDEQLNLLNESLDSVLDAGPDPGDWFSALVQPDAGWPIGYGGRKMTLVAMTRATTSPGAALPVNNRLVPLYVVSDDCGTALPERWAADWSEPIPLCSKRTNQLIFLQSFPPFGLSPIPLETSADLDTIRITTLLGRPVPPRDLSGFETWKTENTYGVPLIRFKYAPEAIVDITYDYALSCAR
jgi:hypothetical protein